MNRLLSAGFARMWKSTVFHVLAMLFAVAAVGMRILAYVFEKKNVTNIALDDSFFMFAGFLGIVMAIFVSLFVGTEYSDGTIRNKLVAGHSRVSVYLSNLILCTAAGAIFSGVYWVCSMIVGIPLSGFFTMGADKLFLLIAMTMMLIMAYCAIFVCSAMCDQRKSVVSVITLVVAFILFVYACVVYSKLTEPEMYESYSYEENGVWITEEAEPNPNYPRGAKRARLEFMFDFMPGNQGMRISEMQSPQLEPISMLYSLIIVVVMTAAGMFLFCKKNVR